MTIEIYRHSTYGASMSAFRFEKVFNVRWTQTTSEFAVFSFETLRPTAGLLSGPRYATLYIDGVAVGTGEIIGYPIALAGDVITVEVACRPSDHSARIDAVFAAIPVSQRLVDKETPRRSQPYVASDIYQHPLDAQPRLVPIGGVLKAGFEIRGEGYAQPDHPALGMTVSVIDAPISRLRLTVSSTHNEFLSRVLNFGAVVGEQDTLTPDEYKSAMESLTFTGSNFEQLSASVEVRPSFSRPSALVTVRRPRTDPLTFLRYGRKDVTVSGETFDPPSLQTVVAVQRARREDLVMTLNAGVNEAYGGARNDDEQLGLANAELGITQEIAHTKTGWPGSPGYIRRFKNVGASFWKEGGADAQLALRNLASYGAAKILRAAHCVRLDIDCLSSTARLLTLEDRITVRDARLEGGVAVGQVKSIEWSESEDGGLARVSILVPVGSGGEFVAPSPAGSIFVNGTAAQDPDINALKAANVGYFVEDFEISGGIEDQLAVVAEINAKNQVAKPVGQARTESEEMINVLDYLPKPTFRFGFRQTSRTEPMDSRFNAIMTVPVQKGI